MSNLVWFECCPLDLGENPRIKSLFPLECKRDFCVISLESLESESGATFRTIKGLLAPEQVSCAQVSKVPTFYEDLAGTDSW